MKRMILLSWLIWVPFAMADETITNFINDIDSAWTSRNYSLILDRINLKLTETPDDPMALGLLPYYYLYCAVDVPKAHNAACMFSNVVYQTGRQDVIPLADVAMQPIFGIPVSSTGTYTQAKRDALHAGLDPYFPGIISVANVALRFEKSTANHPTLTINSMPSNEVLITMFPCDDFARGGAATPFLRVYTKDSKIAVTAPAQTNSLFLKRWTMNGTNVVGTNTTYSFQMLTNTTITAVYE